MKNDNETSSFKTYAFRGSAHLQPLIDEHRIWNGMASDSEALRALVAAGLRACGLGAGSRLSGSGRRRGRPRKVDAGQDETSAAGLCDALGGSLRTDENGHQVCDYRTYAEVAGGAVAAADLSAPVSLLSAETLRTQYRDLMGQPVLGEAERAEMRAKANGDA